MDLKPSKKAHESCYPFMYEESAKCDFEILTDELCRKVGGVISNFDCDLIHIKEELEYLQPLIYHLNGSIRGKLAIFQEDLDWLLKKTTDHNEMVKDAFSTFILPRGKNPVPALNSCSSMSKHIIRVMTKIQREEGIDVPEILSVFTNVLCNYFFILTVVINKSRDEEEIPFISKSYKPYKLKRPNKE